MRASQFTFMLMILILLCPLLEAQVVVDLPPPTGNNDWDILQPNIDENPGATLMLQPGIYRIGFDWVVIPHGITIQGATDEEGNLLTTIQGPGWIFHVRAIGEHAHDDIRLRNLAMFGGGTCVYHAPVDYGGGGWQPGGGNLTVEGCWIENGTSNSIWSRWASDVSLVVRDCELLSWGEDTIRLQNGTYRSVDIYNNAIEIVDKPDPHVSSPIKIINGPGGWWDYQLPPQSGPININENWIRAGTHAANCIVVLGPVGKATVKGNFLDATAPFAGGINWESANDAIPATKIVENTFAGGEDNGPFRVGVSFHPWRYGGTSKVLFKGNTFTGCWTVGVEVFGNSENNLFIDTDFTDAQVFPGVYWNFGIGTQKNTVTDNSGVEQSWIDDGTENHFQGTS
ncbi:MAG: hypothetical protein ACWGQW_06400, partial [bacterium]